MRNQRGVGLVAVLLALLIAAALYFGYFKMQSAMRPSGPGGTEINTVTAVVCRTNRQNIERDITMWSVDHPDEQPSFAALQAAGIRIPRCPEGGRYDLVGTHVRCSVHRE